MGHRARKIIGYTWRNKALNAKMIFLAALLATSYAVDAEPNKASAQNWLTQFRQARELSMNSATLKDPVKRRELMPKLIALRNEAEKLFGPAMPHELGNCSAAANAVVSVLDSEIGLMTAASQAEAVSGLAMLAWEGALQYGACWDRIENLSKKT